MTQHEDEALVFGPGDLKALPHTLSQTRPLTLALIDWSEAEGTAVFELHNPDAQQDSMVGELIAENEQEVEKTNRWRDKLHLPEKAIPVDTFTMPTEVLHCKLHQKLQVGDQVWVVTDISADQVTVTPGHHHETRLPDDQ
jgi:hypothetical protein